MDLRAKILSFFILLPELCLSPHTLATGLHGGLYFNYNAGSPRLASQDARILTLVHVRQQKPAVLETWSLLVAHNV